MNKTIANAAAKCHPRERQAYKNIAVCAHPPYSLDLPSSELLALPQSLKTLKGKHLELIQGIKIATAVCQRSHEEEDF